MSSLPDNSFNRLFENNDEQFRIVGSQQASTVRQLLNYIKPAFADERSLDVLNRFLGNDKLPALAVVNARSEPVGLVTRGRITELFVRPFSRDLLHKQSISEIMDVNPIIADIHASIDDVAKIIIDADMRHMVSGFIIVENGLYAGMATGHALLEEITERKQQDLYYLAHYDQLTRIPNRTLFMDRLHMACQNSSRNDKLAALIFIDLDRFKFINDSLGHSYGDQLLITVAKRLTLCVRESDTVARLGGDEFVIILQNLRSAEDTERVANVIIQKIQEPLRLFEREIHITASLGIALYPLHDKTLDGLIRKADAAMYQVKQQTRNDFLIYSEAFERNIDERLTLEADLKNALNRRQFSLYYQPQIHLENKRVAGVEALIRWRHPELGLISPAKFIPIAEQTGLIIDIGEWVIREACQQHREWIEQGLPPIRIGVNISASHFHHKEFCSFIRILLADTGVDPRFIELELTESMVMINIDHAIETMNELRSMGFKLAIDDFGTGYSSLSYVCRFPIDRIKIDQSFIRNIERLPTNEAIVRTILTLGDYLGLEIIAEGVETGEELNCIRKHNCQEVQGYHFSKPVPADEFKSWYGLFTA